MSRAKILIPRRAVLGGLLGLGGLSLAGCSEGPPTYGNLLRMGDLLTYRAFRALIPRQALAPEYSHADITSVPAIGTTNPADPHQDAFDSQLGPLYERLRAGSFADWRLSIQGAVERPGLWSLADLKRLPARTQITKHTCEEGWSAISQWTGAPLRLLLQAVGVKPSARFVNFYAFDDIADGIDMIDALHPQTILAYAMNGRDLPLGHGAPLRARVETQLGYKSMKFLRSIVVTERFDDLGKLGYLQAGWSWYTGI